MNQYCPRDTSPQITFNGVYMAGKPENTRWDVCCEKGVIQSVEEHIPSDSDSKQGVRFLSPSLAHCHIHLDKAFLLSHPKYADLEIEKGDFAEAMKLTSEAKSRFEHDDLLERGRVLIEESISFGVTHMRAFTEVDLSVGMKCLDAGLALKNEFKDRCYIQICVFAQDPIYSYHDKGKAMVKLLDRAANREGVEAFGTTPYVEKDGDMKKQRMNMEFAIRTAKRYFLHLDFHIDYNLDPKKESVVFECLRLLHALQWPSNWDLPTYRTVVFGHCTRLTLFKSKEWLELREKAQGLPVSFVGLPTSDLFMMGRPTEDEEGSQRVRGTLQVLQIIRKYGLNAAIGINNVGNAFTPQGSCDPLSLASFGVGLYQAATKVDTDLLLQCVSNRAKLAIGIPLSVPYGLELDCGDPADFVIIGDTSTNTSNSFRSRTTTHAIICDPSIKRTTVFNGEIVSDR